MLLFLCWPKKLLLGIVIGVDYKLSYNGVGEKVINDFNRINGI
jgi:hypothetical protein